MPALDVDLDILNASARDERRRLASLAALALWIMAPVTLPVPALRAHPSILVPLVFAFTDRFTVGLFTTTLALYRRRMHELSSTQIGLAIAVFRIPFALLFYPFGRLAERRSPTVMLCAGSLLYGFGMACVG